MKFHQSFQMIAGFGTSDAHKIYKRSDWAQQGAVGGNIFYSGDTNPLF
jgi:hypothetical protein